MWNYQRENLYLYSYRLENYEILKDDAAEASLLCHFNETDTQFSWAKDVSDFQLTLPDVMNLYALETVLRLATSSLLTEVYDDTEFRDFYDSMEYIETGRFSQQATGAIWGYAFTVTVNTVVKSDTWGDTYSFYECEVAAVRQ